MNDTTPTTAGDAGHAPANDASENEDIASKISDIVFKIFLGIFGLGIGGLIGFVIAVFAGLISFEC